MRALVPLLGSLVLASACGGGGDAPDGGGLDAADAGPQTSLDDFLPPLPTPDGTTPAVFAGQITEALGPTELLPGAARHGLVGDFYLRNARVRFTIQAPWRAMATLPYGGNVTDGSWLDHDDFMGELGFMFSGGRSCAHERVEVVLDGSGGGPAVVRAFGRSAINDSGNLRGAIGTEFSGIFADREDHVECATTYTLAPGSNVLEVAWTLFNGADTRLSTSFMMMADTGGAAETFAPRHGFFSKDIDILGSNPTDAPYAVVQAPGIAYGYVPRHRDPATPNAILSTAALQMLFEATYPVDIISAQSFSVRMEPGAGETRRVDLVVAHDPSEIEAHWRDVTDQAATAVTGAVAFTPGGLAATGARVAAFTDADGDGVLDADDPIVTYAIVDEAGGFDLELGPGAYLLRGTLDDVARSAVVPVTVGTTPVTVAAGALALPEPVRWDYAVIDDATDLPVPAKITVIGRGLGLDGRVYPSDRRAWVVATRHAAYGTTTPVGGDPGDEPLLLPAGGPYRVIATHGPEWTIASRAISPVAGGTGTVTLRIRRVVDTTGYVAAEFHQHSEGSADNSVPFEVRLRSLLVEGIEFFASTDHDYLSDYDPLIDVMGLRGLIDAVVGVESTSAAWGHFNAFPLELDLGSPNQGAPDWASGEDPLYDMTPAQLWDDQRSRGARVVQVNHPHALGLSSHQNYFTRSGLVFDFAAHTYYGSPLEEVVPREFLRLPEGEDGLFSDAFDAIEVWNGLGAVEDVNGDGVRELQSLDNVTRDWMNFLSLGKVYAPLGNSDSHARETSPAGLPRTLVRVDDDSSAAIAAGVDEDVWSSILTGRDLIVTDGPMLRVSADGGATSAIGRVISVAPGGTVSLQIDVQTPGWMGFDTIEVFANATFDPAVDNQTTIVPLACFNARPPELLTVTDPCTNAPFGGARPMTVDVVPVPAGSAFTRRQVTVTIDLTAAEILTRAGARGEDAWVVVRVRGNQGIYPMHTGAGALSGETIDALLAAETDADLVPILTGRGTPAAAFTAPIFIDFDGGGYVAPFAP